MRFTGNRVVAVTMVVLLTGALSNPPDAFAIEPPTVDPALVPPDGAPGPEQPMRQSNTCARTIAVAEPDVALPAPGFAMLNVARAWQHSTGNGVSVAVIDTGVTPNRRLPVVPGGDYIMGGDGLTDCDAHGTIVASVIAAAPQGTPMPAPMPPTPAFPPPAGGPAGNRGPTAVDSGPRPGPAAGAGDRRGSAGHGGRGRSRRCGPARDGDLDPPVLACVRTADPGPGDIDARKKAGTVATLSRAIVHAANQGAQVINVSVTACVSAADPLDQRAIGAAVWYAATVKDAVIVAAAGNEGEDGCSQNPAFNPLDPDDPRDWRNVKTVSSPSWFSDYVLSVGAVDNTGAPVDRSLAGPWIGAAAPGVGIMGLSPQKRHRSTPIRRCGRANAIPVLGHQFLRRVRQRGRRSGAGEVPATDGAPGHQPDSADVPQPTPRGGQPGGLRRRRSRRRVDIQRPAGRPTGPRCADPGDDASAAAPAARSPGPHRRPGLRRCGGRRCSPSPRSSRGPGGPDERHGSRLAVIVAVLACGAVRLERGRRCRSGSVWPSG